MKKKIIVWLFIILCPVFYLAGSYGHIELYKWADLENSKIMAGIDLTRTTYHPSRIYMVPEMALFGGVALSLGSLFMAVRYSERKASS